MFFLWSKSTRGFVNHGERGCLEDGSLGKGLKKKTTNLLGFWHHLKGAELVTGLPHVPLLLWTHVRTRPHKHLGHVQIRPLGPT